MSSKYPLLSALCLVSLMGCTPQQTTQLPHEQQNSVATDASSSDATVFIAWWPVAHGEGKVDLFMNILGTNLPQVHVGIYAGDYDDSGIQREWWAGTDKILSVERKDATHLSVMESTMEQDAPQKELMTVEVPSGLQVACIDDKCEDE
jgi:hypothetical protein